MIGSVDTHLIYLNFMGGYVNPPWLPQCYVIKIRHENKIFIYRCEINILKC